MADFKWYALRVISGREIKIKDQILVELENSNYLNYVNQIIVPVEKVVQLRKGKKVVKEKNFYPGYIIVEVMLTTEVHYKIKSVVGVFDFLGTKDSAVPLRANEINRILGKMEEVTDEGEQIEVPYMVGEPIKIIDGPFNGFNGIIEEINEEKKKLKVEVKIFGRRTPVELNYMQVEKS
ncbi:MAG: transcription termination/antitermination protein NusG [Bacteroidota bacterium]|nr:transcription termination/antitermination protein NusG [Bacteroidota bacterium]